MISGINKTLSSGKTSSFGIEKTFGEIEVGFNCFVRRTDQKRSESYICEDFLFSTFGMREKSSRGPNAVGYGNRFNSMPALMQII